jgi:hypothetical protein
VVTFRRFLVVFALMVWLGGFTVYGAVVVPIGRNVLGPHSQQTIITRQVTNYLNLIGGVALLPLLWETAAGRDPSTRRRRRRWAAWGGLALTLVLLAGLHVYLDQLLGGAESTDAADHDAFGLAHRAYLIVGTVQWVCGLLYLGLSLSGWRAEDGDVKGAGGKDADGKGG